MFIYPIPLPTCGQDNAVSCAACSHSVHPGLHTACLAQPANPYTCMHLTRLPWPVPSAPCSFCCVRSHLAARAGARPGIEPLLTRQRPECTRLAVTRSTRARSRGCQWRCAAHTCARRSRCSRRYSGAPREPSLCAGTRTGMGRARPMGVRMRFDVSVCGARCRWHMFGLAVGWSG